MSLIRPRPLADPLVLEAAGAWGEPGFSSQLEDCLVRARAALLGQFAGLDLARLTLEAYNTSRPASGLYAILQAAGRIREAVDRLVIVAGGGIAPATRLLAATCCHPFHNQLSRGERGGRPRLAWLDGGSTTDEIRGLLDVVAPPGRPPSHDLLDRWALFAADAPRDDAGSLAILRFCLTSGEGARFIDGPPFVAVTAPASRLARLAEAEGCQEWFRDLATIESPLGVLTAAGLLPAATIGIDVVQLLKGASAMLVRFAEAPVAVNPVLLDAAAGFTATACGRPARRFVVEGRGLCELSDWHRHLRPCSDADPAAVTRIWVGAPRRDELMQTGLPEAAAATGLGPTAGELSGEQRPGRMDGGAVPADVTIRLPRLDEHALGQLLQLLALSAAVEERLPGTV